MEKDWVVVLYGDDSSHLATVNANVRTIDQVMMVKKKKGHSHDDDDDAIWGH